MLSYQNKGTKKTLKNIPSIHTPSQSKNVNVAKSIRLADSTPMQPPHTNNTNATFVKPFTVKHME